MKNEGQIADGVLTDVLFPERFEDVNNRPNFSISSCISLFKNVKFSTDGAIL